MDTNERVRILELQSASAQLKEVFRDWQTLSEGTRGDKGLYHANIDPALGYAMTEAQWKRAVDVLEKELGLQGQPRAVVIHDKEGRQHAHVVWSRTDIDTMTLRDDGRNYDAHERASAALEREFGHEHVPGKHSKRDREKQPDIPKSEVNHAEWQLAERTHITKAERVAEITALRASVDNGQAFKNALEQAGYTLSQGDRGYVLVQSGEIFVLSRYVEGMRARDITAFMADVPLEALPKTEDVQAAQKQALLDRQKQPAAPAPAPIPAPAEPEKPGVEVSKFLKAPAPASMPEAAPEVSKFLKDPSTTSLEKAIADRQAAELQKWQAWHAQELKQTAHVLDRDVAEKMKNFDAVQQAAVTRLEREHKRQEADIWERLQRKINPAGAAEKAQTRRLEAEAMQRRLTQERKDYLALQIQSKQLDLDALKERHDQKQRDVTGSFPAERERYLKDQATAQRLLTELQEQRRHEEERQRRDGPEPPGRVR